MTSREHPIVHRYRRIGFFGQHVTVLISFGFSSSVTQPENVCAFFDACDMLSWTESDQPRDK